MTYNPYHLTPDGMRRAMDPSERAAGARAVALVDQSLSRLGLPALAFLPIHQPERERGEPAWRLTAAGGKVRHDLVIPEATLDDPVALDAFLRDSTTDEKGAPRMAA